MSYCIAGIDVHKKMLAVAVADVMREGEQQFERLKVGTTSAELRRLAEWLIERQVQEVVMESTAQYWKPVWEALEQYWQPEIRKQFEQETKGSAQGGEEPPTGFLHLAQAKSNRGPRGRKNDMADAERLVKRLIADELILSFVPDAEQRLWRTVTRKRHQLVQDRVRLRNQMEMLLEEAHIKLSSMVSDLFGLSGQRMLLAIAAGESQPEALAKLAHCTVQATPEQLADALAGCTQMKPAYRTMIGMAMAQLQMLDAQMLEVGRLTAKLMESHQSVIERLCGIPGIGPEAAQQIVAEIGPRAKAFGSAKELASWIGVCPGQEQSADQTRSTRSPKGNRPMRRLLNQAAHAAVRMKGCIFEVTFRRLIPRLKYQEAIWAIAHRLARVLWKILHESVVYIEHGGSASAVSQLARMNRMIRELCRLGYKVDPPRAAAGARA
jgi:transposase